MLVVIGTDCIGRNIVESDITLTPLLMRSLFKIFPQVLFCIAFFA
jgi:hypothetical protein